MLARGRAQAVDSGGPGAAGSSGSYPGPVGLSTEGRLPGIARSGGWADEPHRFARLEDPDGPHVSRAALVPSSGGFSRDLSDALPVGRCAHYLAGRAPTNGHGSAGDLP